MDIIFQSGEFHSDGNDLLDFFNQLLSALIGASTAYLIFRNQIKVNRENEEEKKKQFEKDKLNYLSALLNQIVDVSKTNINRLDKYIVELSKGLVYLPDFGFTLNHHAEVLNNKVNQEEYYHAFVNATKGTEASNVAIKFIEIFEALNYYTEATKNISSIIIKEAEINFNNQTKYTSCVNSVYKMVRKINKKLKIENRIELHDKLSLIINNSLEIRKTDEEYTSKIPLFLLNPLLEAISSPENYGDPQMIKLANKINRANFEFNGINKDIIQLKESIIVFRQDKLMATKRIILAAQILKVYGFSKNLK